MSKNDISIAHRLGTSENASKPRPIIVKFLRREQRLQVLRARSSLKGKKNLAICPDLTRPRAYLLKQQQRNGTTAWSDFNGRIWREPNATEKRSKLKRVEIFPEKFPGIYADHQVVFSNVA